MIKRLLLPAENSHATPAEAKNFQQLSGRVLGVGSPGFSRGSSMWERTGVTTGYGKGVSCNEGSLSSLGRRASKSKGCNQRKGEKAKGRLFLVVGLVRAWADFRNTESGQAWAQAQANTST